MKKTELSVSSLTRHCNEALILSALQDGRKHGYELAQVIETRSEQYFSFNHGTLYPILHKLEKEGMIRGTWKQEGPKRKRKYYTLTERGRKYCAASIDEWQTFFTNFFNIAGGDQT